MTDDNRPFTTEELSESELGAMSLPDQIRYAVYNDHYRLSEIVDVTTFSAEWATDIVEDLVAEGELHEGSDQHGLFYEFTDALNRDDMDPDERAEIHEQARREHASATIIGDAEDIEAAFSPVESDDEKSDETEALGKASMTSDGRTDDDTVSGPKAAKEDIDKARSKHGGRLPVDRDYDWDSEKLDPETVHTYISADGEKEDIVKEIEDRRETGKLPHFRIPGPTGCGKTSLGEDIAVGMSAPCFVINCHDGLRPNNLLGMPTYVGDETWWVDGPVTKALLASQERPTCLILDEGNRTDARTLGVLMSILDHQCSVTLNARGGEKVQGDPMNLIVFMTMNHGSGYIVNQIDRAQIRRFGNTFPTDYIGMYNPEREAHLIEWRTKLGPEEVDSPDEVDMDEYEPSKPVESMVEAANEIRKKAKDDSNVDMGVPTSTMLDWASTAWSYRDDEDADGGPLVKAAYRSLIDVFFLDEDKARDIVTTTVESHLRGMDIDLEDDDELVGVDHEGDGSESESAGDAGDISLSDETWLQCTSCGFYTESEEADESVVTSMECPDCSSTLVPKEAS